MSLVEPGPAGRHRAYKEDDAFIESWQWGDPVLRNVTDLLLAAVRGRTGRALDVGCGTGRAAVALARTGLQVDALDVDSKVIAIAQRVSWRLGVWVNYQTADLSVDGRVYADQSYDVVSCIEVLEHVQAWRQLVANLRRLLKPGGLLFLSVPHDPRQFGVLDAYAGHLRRFTRQEILDTLPGFDLRVDTAGFPSFRAITWLYGRALCITGREHAAWAGRRGRSRLGSLIPRTLYGLSKADNLFNGLGWGTTLVVRGVKAVDTA